MFGFWKGTKAKLLPNTGIEFSDGRFYTFGAGSPEGVVTATIGSFYSDTTNGYLYTKNSGSGNTGWARSVTLTEMATGSALVPGLPFVGDPNTGIFQPTADQLAVSTNSTTRFLIDENGRLYNVYSNDSGTSHTSTLGPGWLLRAWINFDGTAGPPTIRAAGNFSSIVDEGTGEWDLNFTVAMPDTDYTVLLGQQRATATPSVGFIGSSESTINSVKVQTYNTSASLVDFEAVCVGIAR